MLSTMHRDEFIKTLRTRGYKATPQRIAIYETLLEKEHPSVEEIYETIKKRFPSVSLTTVYQTLHLLADLGLVIELGFSDKSARFDTNIKPHINVICPSCGKITDYEDSSVQELWTHIRQKFANRPVTHRFDVYVPCDQCL